MKTHTRVVVVGGGVTGCSVLYHLTRKGWSDVALCERADLASGAASHAIGHYQMAASVEVNAEWSTSSVYPVLRIRAIGLQSHNAALVGRCIDAAFHVEGHILGPVIVSYGKDLHALETIVRRKGPPITGVGWCFPGNRFYWNRPSNKVEDNGDDKDEQRPDNFFCHDWTPLFKVIKLNDLVIFSELLWRV